jgi:hypothetical protein
MRSPEYVAAAVNYYKTLLYDNRNETANALSALKRTYNRGNYTSGLAFGQSENFVYSAVQGHIGEYIGRIKVINGEFLCVSDFPSKKGDAYKVLRNNVQVCGASFEKPAKGGFYINAHDAINGDSVYITTDSALSENLLSVKRKIKIDLSLNFTENQKAHIIAQANGKEFEFYSDDILQNAKSQPLDIKQIKENFEKTDNFPFGISFKNVVCGNVFMAKSALNSFRRDVFEALFEQLSYKNISKIDENILKNAAKTAKNESKNAQNTSKIAVISHDFSFLNGKINIDFVVFKPYDYADTEEYNKFFNEITGKTLKYLYLPAFLNSKDEDIILNTVNKFDGIYSEGNYAVKLCEKIISRFLQAQASIFSTI